MYISPEKIINRNYCKNSDVFSLGCIIYELFTNSLYYSKFINSINNDYNILNTIRSNEKEYINYCENTNNEILSLDIKDFEKKILLKTLDKQNNRINIDELINDEDYQK